MEDKIIEGEITVLIGQETIKNQLILMQAVQGRCFEEVSF